jgi:predicted RNA-binding protein with TRAM domain
MTVKGAIGKTFDWSWGTEDWIWKGRGETTDEALTEAEWEQREAERREEREQREKERWESMQAHDEASERPKPVDIGDVFTAGISDFSAHHSGRRDAIVKVEGFTVFIRDAEDDYELGDILRAKITSFNRRGESADAVVLERLD